jgi:hypothetical protein
MGTPGGIEDPRAFRWVEAGISGLAQLPEFDATAILELPELEASDLRELDFRVLTDGTVVGSVPPEALRPIVAELELEPPATVRAVRQSAREWAVGAQAVDATLVDLPAGIDALMLAVAVPPEVDLGETTYDVDGEVLAGLPEEPSLRAALTEIERLGRERFEAFVARADKVDDGRWELTVDPL